MSENIKKINIIDEELNNIVERIADGKLAKSILKRHIIFGMNLENRTNESLENLNDFQELLSDLINIIEDTDIVLAKNCKELIIKVEKIKEVLYEKFQDEHSQFDKIICENIESLNKEIELKGKNLQKDISSLDKKIKETLRNYEDSIKDIENDSKNIFKKLESTQLVCDNTEKCSNRMEESLELLEKQIQCLMSNKEKQFDDYIKVIQILNKESMNQKLEDFNENIKDSNNKLKSSVQMLDMSLYQTELLLKRITDPVNGKVHILKIKRLALEGDVESQIKLADIYELEEENYKEAFRWYLEAAKNDNSEAQYQVGRYYENSYGTNRSVKKALEYYEKSAANNYIEAIYKLGEIYEKGEFGEKDFGKAFFYFLAGAELGNAECQFKVGDYYYTGVGVEVDYDKSIKWLEQSMNNGYKLAKNLLHEVEGKLGNNRLMNPTKAKSKLKKQKRKKKSSRYNRQSEKSKGVYGLIKDNIKKLKRE